MAGLLKQASVSLCEMGKSMQHRMKNTAFALAASLLCCLGFAPDPAFADRGESAPGRMCSLGQTGRVHCIRSEHVEHDLCSTIEQSALEHELDPNFFARLLWQESRFDANALSHANAMGIAQFIRSTADLRGLKDPYNPADAIAHSAAYLGELARRYGNVGLAAVAYNGGEWRADSFLRGGGLKRETINYVRIITGLPAETWRDVPPKALDLRLDAALPFQAACIALATGRRISPLKIVSAHKPWGVQLAFGESAKQAKSRYRARVRRCESVVGKERVDILRIPNRVRGRPSYFMARIGRNTRSAADKLCRRARRAGCPCAVYRNP